MLGLVICGFVCDVFLGFAFALCLLMGWFWVAGWFCGWVWWVCGVSFVVLGLFGVGRLVFWWGWVWWVLLFFYCWCLLQGIDLIVWVVCFAGCLSWFIWFGL